MVISCAMFYNTVQDTPYQKAHSLGEQVRAGHSAPGGERRGRPEEAARPRTQGKPCMPDAAGQGDRWEEFQPVTPETRKQQEIQPDQQRNR